MALLNVAVRIHLYDFYSLYLQQHQRIIKIKSLSGCLVLFINHRPSLPLRPQRSLSAIITVMTRQFRHYFIKIILKSNLLTLILITYSSLYFLSLISSWATKYRITRRELHIVSVSGGRHVGERGVFCLLVMKRVISACFTRRGRIQQRILANVVL